MYKHASISIETHETVFVILYSTNWIIIGLFGGIEYEPEASKLPVMSQSWVSHESVMSQPLETSGGATLGHLLVMKGSIFFNKTLWSPSGEWIEHVWTLFGVKKAWQILGGPTTSMSLHSLKRPAKEKHYFCCKINGHDIHWWLLEFKNATSNQ